MFLYHNHCTIKYILFLPTKSDISLPRDRIEFQVIYRAVICYALLYFGVVFAADSNLTNDKQRENQGDTKQDNFHGLPQKFGSCAYVGKHILTTSRLRSFPDDDNSPRNPHLAV